MRPFVEVLSEQFLWFLKSDFLRFHHDFLLFGKSNLSIFQMCFIRITIAYLCLKMIDFDAVDFSERRSEEVMFLLTLSVVFSYPNFDTHYMGGRTKSKITWQLIPYTSKFKIFTRGKKQYFIRQSKCINHLYEQPITVLETHINIFGYFDMVPCLLEK